MRVDIVTKEYPPEIYGGAGVHATELVKALRAEELLMAAETAAEKVRKSGVPYAFPPMNSRERRLLHPSGTNIPLTGACAGFDVLITEPPPADNVLLNLRLPNFILTPHSAWASSQAMQTLVDQLIDNIEAWVAGAPRHVVTA